MRGVRVEEAAAVGAELLDRLLARHGADGNDLLRPFQRRRFDRAGERLRNAERDKRERDKDGDGQEHVERAAREIDPEVSNCRRFSAGESAHQRKRHRETRRGRHEVMHGETEHLREMAHRRLAAVVLPVGVGDEGKRGVEGKIGRNAIKPLGVERQEVLQPLKRVERRKTDDAESQHGHGVDEPALLARGIDAGEPVESAFDWRKDWRQERALAREHSARCSRSSGTAAAITAARMRAICAQPTIVMMILSRSPRLFLEFLGMKQRVDEVEAEQHGDAQANDRFGHVRLRLKARTGARVKAHQRKEHGAEAEEDEIEHICLPSKR